MAYQAHFTRSMFSIDEKDHHDSSSYVLSFRDLQKGSNATSEVSEFAPEDVDSSDAGWATDFVLTILGLCFLITSCSSYPSSKRHFSYMHLGTAIAHLFGGLAHAFFPNRASDGTGMIGFYITMILGYGGNCMRYGLGWGLPKCWSVLAGLNFLYLSAAGIFAIVQMEATTDQVDSADPDTSDPVVADSVFGYGELLCAVGEIAACIAYLVKRDRSVYAWTATCSNLFGWIAVYAVGLWSAGTDKPYDTRVTQLIFHYSMIVFLWAINEMGVAKDTTATESTTSRKKPQNSSRGEDEESVGEGNDVVESKKVSPY